MRNENSGLRLQMLSADYPQVEDFLSKVIREPAFLVGNSLGVRCSSAPAFRISRQAANGPAGAAGRAVREASSSGRVTYAA